MDLRQMLPCSLMINKKLLSALLVACLAWVLPVAAQPSPASPGPTLSKVAKRQVLYAGYREDAPPFSYLASANGQPVGYMWEVCTHFFKAVEAQAGHAIRVVPISVTENARTMMLKTGITDLDCGGAGNTVARQKQVDLSLNVYVSETKVMVRRDSGIASFAQLADKKLVTIAGDTAERQVKHAALGENIVLQHLLAATPQEAMGQLAQGEADAFAADDVVLAAQRAATPGDFIILDAALAKEPYAIMLPKDDAAWKGLLDTTIAGLMQSGELEKIYEKWFLAPIPPLGHNLALPMSPSLKAAIQTPGDTPVN